MSKLPIPKVGSKYVAIKVAGMPHWLWFQRDKTDTENSIFTGRDGWGKGGALTSITIAESKIEGHIDSAELQYN